MEFFAPYNRHQYCLDKSLNLSFLSRFSKSLSVCNDPCNICMTKKSIGIGAKHSQNKGI